LTVQGRCLKSYTSTNREPLSAPPPVEIISGTSLLARACASAGALSCYQPLLPPQHHHQQRCQCVCGWRAGQVQSGSQRPEGIQLEFRHGPPSIWFKSRLFRSWNCCTSTLPGRSFTLFLPLLGLLCRESLGRRCFFWMSCITFDVRFACRGLWSQRARSQLGGHVPTSCDAGWGLWVGLRIMLR
jgi:hypothetical protein